MSALEDRINLLKLSIKESKDSLAPLEKELYELEKQKAVLNIDQAKKGAIAAVQNYNRLAEFLGGDTEHLVLLSSFKYVADGDGFNLSEYSLTVEEYNNGWFPSEINC